MDSSYSRNYFFLALLVLFIALNAAVFYPFLGVLIFAATFATLVGPWYRGISKAMPNFPGLAALITILLVLLIIITPLIIMGVLVFNEAQNLYLHLVSGTGIRTALGSALDVLTARLPSLAVFFPFLDSVDVYIQQFVGYIANNLGVIFSGFIIISVSILITLIALYFFLRDGLQFRKALLTLSPLGDADDDMILNHLGRVVNSVIKGFLLVALVQGVLAGFGYLIFSVPNPSLWGAATTITALIPGIGTAVILVPAALYLFAVGKTSAMVGLLIWGFVVVGGVDNILKPKLIASGLGIHPFLILLSVLGGLAVFGIFGFLLGPLLLGFLFALLDVYKRGLVSPQN